MPSMDGKTYTLKLPSEMDREALIKVLMKSNEHFKSKLGRLATWVFSLPSGEVIIGPLSNGDPFVTLSIYQYVGTECFLEPSVKANTTIRSALMAETKYSQLEFQADASAPVKSDYITEDQLARGFVNRLERIVKRHYRK